jgi:hypothetical protein
VAMNIDYGSVAPGGNTTWRDLSSPQNSSSDGMMGKRPSIALSAAVGESDNIVNQFTELRLGRTLGLDAYTHSHINLLLVFALPGVIWGVFDWSQTLCFVFCFLAIIPCACIVGRATEDIAEHTNETVSRCGVVFSSDVEFALPGLNPPFRFSNCMRLST